ncbi:MAG: hypothetical protein BGO83_17745 [Devosia sp. 66-14]|nr:MAG: hypothetical protein ABS47_16630 [Devosia sp. SCN 66-27]OJX22639.1 MAG: hypothetical protein BGO83_17745 [Devosia sp. 66-14]
MHIRMKLNLNQVKNLAQQLEARRHEEGLTHDQIARILDLNQSQVSRACSGDFASLNETVMRICIFLGVSPPGWQFPVDSDQYKLTAGILRIWKRTPEDTARLLRLLRSIADIRGRV